MNEHVRHYPERVRSVYTERLNMLREFVAQDPSDTQSLSDECWSLVRIGESFHNDKGKPFFLEALEIANELIVKKPEDVWSRINLAESLRAFSSVSEPVPARAGLMKAIAIADKLRTEKQLPDNYKDFPEQLRADLSNLHER